MKIISVVAVSCALIIGALLFSLNYLSQSPSTAELDADIAAVTQQIAEAEAEYATYSGGAIQVLVKVRTEVLKTTAAMLEQKRSSLLRRIDLQYVVQGQPRAADEALITDIESDIAEAVKERDRFKVEADRYTGGLIQTVALMNAATTEMTISQLRLSLLAERYGFAFTMPSDSTPAAPIGQTVVTNEGDAL